MSTESRLDQILAIGREIVETEDRLAKLHVRMKELVELPGIQPGELFVLSGRPKTSTRIRPPIYPAHGVGPSNARALVEAAITWKMGENRGKTFRAKDFPNLRRGKADKARVLAALGALCKRGVIRRVARGVYVYPPVALFVTLC